MTANAEPTRAPVKTMWICMILGWVMFMMPIPGTVFIACPLNLAAFILAIVCVVKSRVGQGVIGLFGTTVLPIVFYFIGLGSMAAIAVSGIEEGQGRQQLETDKR
ncbi:MAG: hypothetical protein LBU23_03065 [Planctomycetota bacterium]|jgi:hypothetical protein|nr:hypothetical protein [Planctomycetota bacterium]